MIAHWYLFRLRRIGAYEAVGVSNKLKLKQLVFIRLPYVEDAVDAVSIPLVADQANSTTDGSNPPGPGGKVAVPAETAVNVRGRDLAYSKTEVSQLPPPIVT